VRFICNSNIVRFPSLKQRRDKNHDKGSERHDDRTSIRHGRQQLPPIPRTGSSSERQHHPDYPYDETNTCQDRRHADREDVFLRFVERLTTQRFQRREETRYRVVRVVLIRAADVCEVGCGDRSTRIRRIAPGRTFTVTGS
jgi:hypothetical protein